MDRSLFDENGMLIVTSSQTTNHNTVLPDAEAGSPALQFDENGMIVVPGQTDMAEQGETPVPAVEVEAETEEGRSFLEQAGFVASDMARGAIDGVQEGAVEMLETLDWMAGEVPPFGTQRS